MNTEQMIAAGVGTALMLGGATSAFGGQESQRVKAPITRLPESQPLI